MEEHCASSGIRFHHHHLRHLDFHPFLSSILCQTGGKRPRISEKELAECEETSSEKAGTTKSRSPTLTPSSEVPTSPSPPNNDSHFSADDPRMMSHTEVRICSLASFPPLPRIPRRESSISVGTISAIRKTALTVKQPRKIYP